MGIYVLVHGGFPGGWYWREVANILRKAGHEVYTPTLTGLGERAHLAGPDINLNTHIQDIVGILDCEDLREVILLGHSSGSMVVTGVTERIPERLSWLVYLDTMIPDDGQSWLDLCGEEFSKIALDLAEKHGDGWRLPLVYDPPRYLSHPLKTVTDSLEIKNPVAVRIPRAYIHCTKRDENSPVAILWPRIDRHAERVKEKGWWYRSLPTGHAPAETMPQEFSELLLELAK